MLTSSCPSEWVGERDGCGRARVFLLRKVVGFSVLVRLVGYFALDMRNADLWWVIALWALFYPSMMLGVLVRGRVTASRRP